MKSNKFGTFGGVFVPSILTILGVIMYLRLPMIVGEAGLWYTLGIIAVAHLISVTTGLSVSSIATDKKVQAGGTYYMISRSLGLPIGGTLGLALFVGLSFSVSLYLIGFSESFLNYWGFDTNVNNIRITGTIILLAVTILTFISTSLAIKTQYFIMTAIGLSLISIFFGKHDYNPSETLLTQTPSAVPLMVLFGIFFPAVTGFEAGVSMSGDLKDPKKSIPLGSILAIVVGLIVYILLAIFFSSTVSSEVLRNDPRVLLNISWIPELVIAGIWGATLSSALGSILGAPRILQATAKDRITPKFFAKGYSASNEPRNALLLTFLIAEAGILIGELDVIARVVSIFFITTYGFLNISAAFERWTSTDFRPEFKVSGWISLLGAIACLVVMIQLDFIAMLGATAIMVLLFLFLKRRELKLDSGDAWSGVWASLVKTGLTYLKHEKLHERNWRPNTIMFAGNPKNRKHMVEIGIAISGKLGVLSGFELIRSEDVVFRREKSILRNEKDDLEYFHHKIYCKNVFEGMDHVARMYGFSGVEPNTILMGWSKNPSNKEHFINTLQSFRNYKYNTIFLNYHHEKKFGDHSSIDIWWGGTGRNLGLAISLIRHLTNSQLWKSSNVRLLLMNPVSEDYEDIYRSVSSILKNYREDIEVKIINNEIDPIPLKQIIEAESSETDLVILEIPNQRFSQLTKYYDDISEILESIGSSLVINASEDFEELEVVSLNAKEITSLREFDNQMDISKVPLDLSKYSEVASDILKIDLNGQKVLELFHKKTIQPVIKDHLYVLNELSKRIGFILKELNRMKELPDLYRRRRAMDKIKNDVLFQINSLFEKELNKEVIPEQIDKISEGISWYQQKLREDYYKYPRRLKISYEKEDFKINKNDRVSLRLLKGSKKIIRYVTRSPFTHQVYLREVARYYQLNNRQVFLKHFFKRFQEEDIAFYYFLRKVTKAITSHLDELEHKLNLDPKNWNYEKKLNELEQEIDKEKDEQVNLLKFYSARLQLEFRKNLQLMNNDLSKLDINFIIRRKTRSAKYYKKIVKEIVEFPYEHILKIKTLLNMILMELSVNSAKNRLEIFHEEFVEKLTHLIHQKFQKILNAVKDLQKLSDPSYDLNKIKIDEDFEVDLREGYDETLERMVTLTEGMPETLEIYSSKNDLKQDEETLSIPVARMVEYYFRSKYELPVEEKFKELITALKKSIYNIKDLLVLAQFHLENLSNSEASKVKMEIWKDVISKIENESENVDGHVLQFKDFTNDQFNEIFEPLSTTKIEESANEYIFGLRNYQGKKVLSGVNRVSLIVGNAFKNVITKLFYSRSEGILLAKSLKKSKDLQSSISHILDLKEKVCPSIDVMNALPPFYVTLFNGKSSIGKDFWIGRPEEEEVFGKAVERYQEGFSGGILILGERNSGKTSFCKYESQKYLKSHKIFSVFSPIQGTITTDGFTQALKKATQIDGDIDQIMNRLDTGTVLIINDLELFWERSSEGLDIIHLLERLIDVYGQKILFIINLNPHAYKLINRLTSFSSHFIDIINFAPFNAEELKDLIMKRHKSSGLNLNIETSKIPLNELQMAQLFNAYFNYSLGNPGTALNGWLSHIHKVSSRELYISKPKNPSLSVLRDLNQEWTMVLAQFVLHKRLTIEKLVKITGWTDSKVHELLLAMQRAGIVIEKASGIHHIDPYIQPFISTTLKEKGILL